MIRSYLTSFLLAAFLTLPLGLLAQSSPTATTMDQIVAMVNDHIILKSDVDQQVQSYMLSQQQQTGQTPQFSEDLWYRVMQNMVERFVMLDQARRDSITVPESQIEETIDTRIQGYVEQLGSESILEQRLGQSIIQYRAELRQNFRQQAVVQELERQRMSQVEITRPEVRQFFDRIPADSLPTIPEQVSISHLVNLPPARSDAEDEARRLAEQLRDSVINHGRPLEEMARRYSDGPNASNGGKIPLINIQDLVPEYSAAASALEPGQISEVVRTSFGFHVIRLNRKLADQIDTNQILITIPEESYDTQAAINRLGAIRDSILNNEEITFSEMARRHSEDPNTASRGGQLLYNENTQDRLFPVNELDQNLYRTVVQLEEGDISQPRPFTTGSGDNTRQAYRIVKLNRRIAEHTANLEQDYERVRSFALQEKRYRMRQQWMDGLKEDTYISYKIPVPEQYR